MLLLQINMDFTFKEVLYLQGAYGVQDKLLGLGWWAREVADQTYVDLTLILWVTVTKRFQKHPGALLSITCARVSQTLCCRHRPCRNTTVVAVPALTKEGAAAREHAPLLSQMISLYLRPASETASRRQRASAFISSLHWGWFKTSRRVATPPWSTNSPTYWSLRNI